MKMDALIVMKEPLDMILAGKKTWEIRGSRCHKRGRIALIQSKSGMVVGTAEIVDCIGPLTVAEYNRNLRSKMGVGLENKLKSSRDFYYAKTYAWVIRNAKRLRKPKRYKHKSGCVVWHKVDV